MGSIDSTECMGEGKLVLPSDGNFLCLLWSWHGDVVTHAGGYSTDKVAEVPVNLEENNNMKCCYTAM